MTYTFKLARRLAVSRKYAMLAAIVMLAACAGETTAPEAGSIHQTYAAPGVHVVPSVVTIESHQRIRFRGERRGMRGERTPLRMVWKVSGGAIDPDGVFTASEPGTYKVVGEGRGRGRGRGSQPPDTSIVVVVPPQTDVVSVSVTPETVTLAAAATHAFAAVGVLSDGDTASIGITWKATGGTIDAGGLYTAGSTPGSYRVVATKTESTLADTATVTIPEPAAPPPSAPTLARVILTPASVSLTAGAAAQFAAYGRNSVGDSVAVAVAYVASGGTITQRGLYTAGQTAGSYRVIASSSGFADTADVAVAVAPPPPPSDGAAGVPYGPFNLLTASVGAAPFTMSMDAYTAANIIGRIDAARTSGQRLMIAMASGRHDKYKTDGVFDMAKWKATMDTYNSPAIKAAVAAGVAEGIVLGNEVMDEPQNRWGANSWGPAGTMTKARVDEMCAYVKNIFPTLPAGVTHDHNAFEPEKSYYVCDFIIDQYRWSKTKGDVVAFRDAGLALARRDGIAIAFSLNILDGGIVNWTTKECPVPLTGGPGTYEPLCRMTADQVRDWGRILGQAGCALFMWRYDSAFMSDPANAQAFRDVAATLARAPARSCRRG